MRDVSVNVSSCESSWVDIVRVRIIRGSKFSAPTKVSYRGSGLTVAEVEAGEAIGGSFLKI
jgi:hypothetical protein